MSHDAWVEAGMTITMYGADWCGDCRRAKVWFDEREIGYDFVDLVEDPAATEHVLARNGGVKRIPVIVFPDDSHLVEPTNDELATHLEWLSERGVEVHQPAQPSPAVVENTHLGRFELLHRGEVVSFATYSERNGTIVVPHVETAPAHRGNGYAAQLIEGLLASLRSDGRKITPLCPFAARHIRDNPQHHDLLS